jgi:hypothetical protein
VAFILLFHTAAAQESRAGAHAGWRPRYVRPGRFTAAQRAAAIATLGKIEGLLRQVPELADPDGFEIQPVILEGAPQDGPGTKPMPGSVVEYILRLMFFLPGAGEGCGCIEVRVNANQSATMFDAQGRHIYVEPPRAMRPRGTPEQTAGILWQVPQATQVYGELWEPVRDIREGRGEPSMVDVLFVGAGALPWKPVTREEFYQARLLEMEGRDGKEGAEFRAGLAKTPYEQWLEGAAQRQKDRERTLAELATFQSAVEVEKMRQTLEQTEREVTENLRKTAEEDRERNRDALAASWGRRDSLRVELERMTPEERRMPTYINNTTGEGPIATGWPLTSDSAPPAWRILTPNYDFWRARRSPVEVRSINVHIGIAGTGLHPKVRNALLQTFKKLDWAAFNRLLDQPR